MVSNAPSSCCLIKSDHEGTPTGEHRQIHGLDTYVTGDLNSSKLLVILTDIFGNRFKNTLLIADSFGKAGYKVYVPDILKGDAAIFNEFDLSEWLPRHTNEITRPIVDEFFKKLGDSEKFDSLGVIGYCFGAKYAVQQLVEGTRVDAGAIAHPSFVSIEEIAALKKPILISAAENDSQFTQELRKQTEDVLKETGVHYQIDLFGSVNHGFAAKADLSLPRHRYAKEKAFQDQLYWFEFHFK